MAPLVALFLELFLVVVLGLKPSCSMSKCDVGFPARLSYFHMGCVQVKSVLL